MRTLTAILCLLAAIVAVPAAAAPQGPVLITVAGAVSNTNRGPFDPFEDALAKAHDVAFERAFAFDRTMLETLGTKTLSVQYPGWPKRYRFEGLLLRDVLAAAGATGTTAKVFALDGYAAEIAPQDMRDYPVMLALKKDGQPLAIGGRGPAWVVFPRDDYPALAKRDDAQWVWSAYLILVE